MPRCDETFPLSSSFPFCSRPPASQITVAVAALSTFAIGSVTDENGEPIRTGQVIAEGTRVITGPDGEIHLQLRPPFDNVVVRLQSNSEMSVSARALAEKHNLSVRLNGGSARMDVDPGESRVSVVTPTAIAAVRGTRFTVDAGDGSTTRVSVVEGTVSTRVALAKLENIDPAVREQSESLRRLEAALGYQWHEHETSRAILCVIPTVRWP